MKINLQKLKNKLNDDLLINEVLEKNKSLHLFKAIKILNEGTANKILFNRYIYKFIKMKLDFIGEISFLHEGEFI